MTKTLKTLAARTVVTAAFSAALVAPGIIFTPALAQTSQVTQNVELTTESVGSFVNSFPEVKALSKSLESEFDVPRSDSPTEGFGAFMQYQGAMARMNETVGKYGFASFMDWMQTMTSVVTAYTFAREGGGMDQQMAQAMAQIDANPNIPEAQKTLMRQQMMQASQSIASIKPSQGNIDAVAGYEDELKTLFEDD